MLNRIQLVALALGLACFVGLVATIGVETIVRDLSRIGWGIALIIALELVIDGFNTLGWWFTFAPRERHMGFGRLYLIRMAGTAFNQAVPAATVGGEPVKVLLLQRHMATPSAVASVVTAKLSFALGQALFVFLGLVLTSHRLEVPAPVLYALYGALALTVVGLGTFLWLQHRGLFSSVATTAEVMRMPQRWVDWLRDATGHIDARIRELHRERPADFALSVGWHLASFAPGVAQVFLLLGLLGLDADVLDAVAIEAFSVLVQLALFLVPASVGVQEGGKMLVFAALGLPAAAGLSVGIVFRLNQLAGIVMGLGSYAFLQWRPRFAPADALGRPRARPDSVT